MEVSVSNPFVAGNPVGFHQFLDRKRELRRVTGRILSGQSIAIVGEPRSGKTSLLLYLAAPETRQELYGDEGKRLLFSYLDGHTFGSLSQTQFWERALQPLHDHALAPDSDSALLQAYLTCQEEGFGTFVLERLLALSELAGWHLILMLDEFDALLHHDVLRSTELFGGLRSLASRCGSLTLVIASRQALARLNSDTQDLSRTSSPYFNILTPIQLGPFPSVAVEELLRRDTRHFSSDDRRFLRRIGGGHPYLLQAASFALWETYVEAVQDATARQVAAGECLYDQAVPVLSNIWRYWLPEKQKALMAIGLNHISSQALNEREFRVERLAQDLQSLGPEIRQLAQHGFITEDATLPVGWRIRPGVLLWWLADEIVRLARDDTPLEEWLLAQEWQGQLTRSEKKMLRNLGHRLSGFLEKGITTLIEAVVKGLVK
jgi:hypothetical protein